MKRFPIILALLMAGVLTASAQLEVDVDGKVFAASTSSHTYFSTEMCVKSSDDSENYNTAIFGQFDPDGSTTKRNAGVVGMATHKDTPCSIGVAGLGNRGPSCENVIGIYGSSNFFMQGASGRYAGYFHGDTYVTGTLTASNVVTSSDARLKKNITPLNESITQGATLQNVMDMNVVNYNYGQSPDTEYFLKTTEEGSLTEEEKAVIMEEEKERQEQKHIGLLAQDLQKIYPELVHEGQDGYLSINYVELVPILIRAIQELKQELDEVKGGDIDAKNARSDATAISTATVTGNVLYQNTPNPFKEKTVIRFSLAPDSQNAAVCIFDMSGKMLKKLPVSASDTSVSINGYELGEGMFLYTLLVNGQEMDTKRMIITK